MGNEDTMGRAEEPAHKSSRKETDALTELDCPLHGKKVSEENWCCFTEFSNVGESVKWQRRSLLMASPGREATGTWPHFISDNPQGVASPLIQGKCCPRSHHKLTAAT